MTISANLSGETSTNWFMVRARAGGLNYVSAKLWRRFMDREVPMAASFVDDARFVNSVSLMVSLSKRSPTRILHAWFSRHRVDTDGLLNIEHDNESIATFWDARYATEPMPGRAPIPNVIEAHGKFAARRRDGIYRWRPTPAELDDFYAQVQSRARKKIPIGRLWFPDKT